MGAECVRAKQSITKLHCKCLNTFPLELMLPHAGLSALILREEATLESARKASSKPSSVFVTLVMVLVPHRSKESARDSYDECHGVAVSLWLATVSAITNLLKLKTPQIPCEKGIAIDPSDL